MLDLGAMYPGIFKLYKAADVGLQWLNPASIRFLFRRMWLGVSKAFYSFFFKRSLAPSRPKLERVSILDTWRYGDNIPIGP